VNDTKPTLQDIADHCGLSRSAVARILAGKGKESRIADATIERVQQAAEKLNYRPNRLARAARNGKTNLVGFSCPNLDFDKISTDADSMVLADSHRNHSVITGSICTHPSFDTYDLVLHMQKEGESMDDLSLDVIDGLIFASPSPQSYFLLKNIVQKIPIVLLGHTPELADSLMCVGINNFKIAKRATHSLLTSGKRNIVVLSPAHLDSDPSIQQRMPGYLEAMEEFGATPCIKKITTHENEFAALLKDDPDCAKADAFLSLERWTTFQTPRILRQQGRSVPVTGFDKIPFAPSFEFDHSFATPYREMARAALEKLIPVIEGKEPYVPGFYEVPLAVDPSV